MGGDTMTMRRIDSNPPALTDAQRALLAHVDAEHKASGGNPKGCRECGDLILAVERERWGKVGEWPEGGR